MQAPSRRVPSTRSIQSLRLQLMAREHAAAVAKRIAEGRRAKDNMPQREVAEAVNAITGRKYDGAAVSRWETGRVQPEDDTMVALEEILEIDLSSYYANGEAPDLMDALTPGQKRRAQLDRIERKVDFLIAQVNLPAGTSPPEALDDIYKALADLDREPGQGKGTRRTAGENGGSSTGTAGAGG